MAHEERGCRPLPPVGKNTSDATMPAFRHPCTPCIIDLDIFPIVFPDDWVTMELRYCYTMVRNILDMQSNTPTSVEKREPERRLLEGDLFNACGSVYRLERLLECYGLP